MSSQDWDDWAKEIDEMLDRTYQHHLKAIKDFDEMIDKMERGEWEYDKYSNSQLSNNYIKSNYHKIKE